MTTGYLSLDMNRLETRVEDAFIPGGMSEIKGQRQRCIGTFDAMPISMLNISIILRDSLRIFCHGLDFGILSLNLRSRGAKQCAHISFQGFVL